jgi:hypothetical protein
VAPPVFKTGLAGIAFAGGFDSLPPPHTTVLFSLPNESSAGQQVNHRATRRRVVRGSNNDPFGHGRDSFSHTVSLTPERHARQSEYRKRPAILLSHRRCSSRALRIKKPTSGCIPANQIEAYKHSMAVRLHAHAVERLPERGATAAEVNATVEGGERFPAKLGRTGFRRNFAFGGLWRGRRYATKQVEVFAVEEGADWLVITVVVKYF